MPSDSEYQSAASCLKSLLESIRLGQPSPSMEMPLWLASERIAMGSLDSSSETPVVRTKKPQVTRVTITSVLSPSVTTETTPWWATIPSLPPAKKKKKTKKRSKRSKRPSQPHQVTATATAILLSNLSTRSPTSNVSTTSDSNGAHKGKATTTTTTEEGIQVSEPAEWYEVIHTPALMQIWKHESECHATVPATLEATVVAMAKRFPSLDSRSGYANNNSSDSESKSDPNSNDNNDTNDTSNNKNNENDTNDTDNNNKVEKDDKDDAQTEHKAKTRGSYDHDHDDDSGPLNEDWIAYVLGREGIRPFVHSKDLGYWDLISAAGAMGPWY